MLHLLTNCFNCASMLVFIMDLSPRFICLCAMSLELVLFRKWAHINFYFFILQLLNKFVVASSCTLRCRRTINHNTWMMTTTSLIPAVCGLVPASDVPCESTPTLECLLRLTAARHYLPWRPSPLPPLSHYHPFFPVHSFTVC